MRGTAALVLLSLAACAGSGPGSDLPDDTATRADVVYYGGAAHDVLFLPRATETVFNRDTAGRIVMRNGAPEAILLVGNAAPKVQVRRTAAHPALTLADEATAIAVAGRFCAQQGLAQVRSTAPGQTVHASFDAGTWGVYWLCR